jgi:pilus assembly protein Flp/PilA
MRRLLGKFAGDQSGATSIEYALIAAGIALAIVGAVQGVGPVLSAKFGAVSTAMP